MIEVEDLHVYYGKVEAVRGVSLRVEPGEIVTLVGANGAGKSSILKAMMGLVPATGKIRHREAGEISRFPAYRIADQGVRMIPEGAAVFGSMTVQENLLVGWPPSARADPKEALADVYRRFPVLAERREQRAGTLSGGQRQMLAIGRALMGRPKLLFMDEPSFGLAPVIVNQLFGLIAELNASGISILLVEQNARRALGLAHRGYVLETGSIVLEGTGDELLAQSAVVDSYLGGGTG